MPSCKAAGQWQTDLGKHVWPQRLLASDAVVCVIGQSGIFVLEQATGRELWRTNDPAISLEARAFIDQDVICVASYGTRAYAAPTGSRLWQSSDALPLGLARDAVWAYQPFSGNQFDGYLGQRVVLLNAATGTLRREFTAQNALGSSSQACGDGESLAVRTPNALYLLQSDGSEQHWVMPAIQCACELAITSQGIVCAEYAGNPLAIGTASPPAASSDEVTVRLIDATGQQRWQVKYAYGWDLSRAGGVLRANDSYVVLDKFPGMVVWDTASGKQLFDTPQTSIIMGPQWIGLDGDGVYWTGFSSQGAGAALERFDVRQGRHEYIPGVSFSTGLTGMKLLVDGLAAPDHLFLLVERESMLTGGMNARSSVIRLAWP